MPKNKNGQDIDLNKYRDPSGLTLGKINFGLWLSEKRKTISKILIIALVAISVFFFSYSIYNYVLYFLHQDDPEVVPVTVNAPRNQVVDLVVSDTQALKINGSYDLISSVQNSNDRFRADFHYCFLAAETEIFCDQGFILPGEKKYLLALNREVPSGIEAVTLQIEDVNWKRIDNREIPDWSTFYQNRLNFSFSGIKMTPSGTSGGRNYLEFTVSNDTAYSYSQVPLNIIFYKDQQVVGANRYVANNLMSGESRPVRLSWLTTLAGVNRSEISPDLDILDESIYLKYQGVSR